MARNIETQGVTVEEAIQVALNRLGVSRSQVEIAILGHPRKGLFGIGAKRARVRATLRETSFSDGEEFEISPGKRRRGRRGRRNGRRRGGPEQAAEEDGPRDARSRQQGRRQDRDKPSGGRRGRGQQGRGRRQEEDPEAKKSKPLRQGERAVNSATPQSSQPPEPTPSVPPREAAAPQLPEPTSKPTASQPAAARQQPPEGSGAGTTAEVAEPKESLTLEQARNRAVELVRELMSLMGFAEATVEAGDWDGPEEICVQIRCEAEGLLIGRHGQTLDAVEHIVHRMTLAGENRDWRVVLDVGGYRQRRRDILLELADRLKVRAMTLGRRVQVSPMSPRDRRVFQAALARDDSVFTRVMGSGFYRRVMIVPVGLEDDDSPVEEVQHEAPRQSAVVGETEDGA